MNIGDVIQKLVKLQDDYGDLEVVICVQEIIIYVGRAAKKREVLALVETVTVDTDCDKVVIGGGGL